MKFKYKVMDTVIHRKEACKITGRGIYQAVDVKDGKSVKKADGTLKMITRPGYCLNPVNRDGIYSMQGVPLIDEDKIKTVEEHKATTEADLD